jgi:hypothetical protein
VRDAGKPFGDLSQLESTQRAARLGVDNIFMEVLDGDEDHTQQQALAR